LKSKFSNEELTLRASYLNQITQEVQQLKELSLAGYVKNYGNKTGLVMNLEESDAFKGPVCKY